MQFKNFSNQYQYELCRLLRRTSSLPLGRYFRSLIILVGFIFICQGFTRVNASPVDDYNEIFGDPDEFVSDFNSAISPKLNEYAGTAVAVSGFVLIVRALASR